MIQALETLHCNMADYVIEELGRVDGTSPEQTWNFPAINQVLLRRVEIEEQLRHLDEQVRDEAQKQMTNEFFVTKTIGNKEVRDNLEDWKESIVAEYEQLVASKGAVKPMSRSLERLDQVPIAPELWYVGIINPQVMTTHMPVVLTGLKSEQP
jgi:hypothetical protein